MLLEQNRRVRSVWIALFDASKALLFNTSLQFISAFRLFVRKTWNWNAKQIKISIRKNIRTQIYYRLAILPYKEKRETEWNIYKFISRNW
jgi:hypothetical protein